MILKEGVLIVHKLSLIAVMICLAAAISGCSMEVDNKQDDKGAFQQVGEEILENLWAGAVESYEYNMQYRYPVSKEFREQQIYKLIGMEVTKQLDAIEFLE